MLENVKFSLYSQFVSNIEHLRKNWKSTFRGLTQRRSCSSHTHEKNMNLKQSAICNIIICGNIISIGCI